MEHSQKRYIPQLDEPVVGVITARMGDNLEVDINAPSRAILPMLAFEGATRRNRPNAKARHLTLARTFYETRGSRPIPYTQLPLSSAQHTARASVLCHDCRVALTSLEPLLVRISPQVGSLVYARVVAADRDLEPELSCTDAQGKVCGSNRRCEGAIV